MSKAKRMMSAAIVAMVFAASPTESSAAPFGFDAISNNSGVADSVDEQFSVNVTNVGNVVTFAFANPGSIASSITALADVLVPEPASLLLLATGLAGIAAASRRRRKQQQRNNA